MTVNIRKSFDAILRKWGHNIMLQRRSPDNTSWKNGLERHTVRHMYPATRGLPQVMQEEREGIVHTVDMIYYFRVGAAPRERDRIYESDERFVEGQTTFLIDYSLPMRGRNGKIEFWTVGATREEAN